MNPKTDFNSTSSIQPNTWANSVELLAPGGDLDSIKAAIVAGADAIYCGLEKFNARNKAANIEFNQLHGILKLAHQYHCRVFITLNIILVDAEIPAVITLLNKLVNTSIDGVIVQDLGLIYLINTHFKSLPIHASTQLTTHNRGQISFLRNLNVMRVNLSRELNIDEIKELTTHAHQHKMETEVFVHGSNCLCFSGICYMSSVLNGNSGNRGRCSQPCRDEFSETQAGKHFPLNLKDNSAFFDVAALADAKVDALKIEGRIKKFHYVFTVVEAWRHQLNYYAKQNTVFTDNSVLYRVFNRDFSNTYLQGDIHKSMFIDNPRDHSAIHHSNKLGDITEETLDKSKGAIFDERTEIIQSVKSKIDEINIDKTPLTIKISGSIGKSLIITILAKDIQFSVSSEALIQDKGTQSLNQTQFLSRLKALNESAYYIQNIEFEPLAPNLFLPFKEITRLKNEIHAKLNNIKTVAIPVDCPKLTNAPTNQNPSVSILISNERDISAAQELSIDVYYQLPSNFGSKLSEYITLFLQHKNLTPWFPAITIDKELNEAAKFLQQTKPRMIVANNSGIAYEANKYDIPWIAGPFFNNTNSYQLICLKENFKCKGAFISNEISKAQLKGIKKPADFELYYSIYHPQILLTTRQCLFHQVAGCTKDHIDKSCISSCKKTASITNLRQEHFHIIKTEGNYQEIYHSHNYLNTDVISDFPNLFSSLFIDMRDIKTDTIVKTEKFNLVKIIQNLITSNSDDEITKTVFNTSHNSYLKGI